MKIAILADTHFGARNDSHIFLDHAKSFFDDVFFPYLKEHDIKTVIHCGDLMDRRKYVNFLTLSNVRKHFFEPIIEGGIDFHCVVGNHDTFYKNTNELNSSNELYGSRYDGIKIYQSPTIVSLGGVKFGFVPWICSENEAECKTFIDDCESQVLIGHFELCGFEVFKGIKHDSGMSHRDLKRYEAVFTGHFHRPQKTDNVQYVGSPYQMTFADVDNDRGFWVLDTDDMSTEFIPNPNGLFHQYHYDDTDTDYQDFLNSDLSIFKGKFVKIYVVAKDKPSVLESMVFALHDAGVADLKVIEQEIQVESAEAGEESELDRTTLEIICSEVEKSDSPRKEEIMGIIKELYIESMGQ